MLLPMKLKTLIPLGALGMTAWLVSGAITLQAQDGPPPGGFSPAKMRERMLERIREQFAVSDDSEWKLISDRLTKVMVARRALGGPMGPRGPFGGPGGPPAMNGGEPRSDQNAGGLEGGPNEAGGPPSDSAAPEGPGGPPPGAPAMFNREPNPELDAMRSAIDAKASSAELKNKIADLKAAQARKRAELQKAQEELKQLLSTRQEAIAMSFGLL
jgi:hypothetical protein